VETAARTADTPAPDVPVEILRTALWRAGRSGLGGDLLDPRTWRPAPAHDVVGALVDHVRDALADMGDLDTVTELLGGLWSGGDAATRQRSWAAEADGDLGAVARRAADVTLL
jgi:carboxylate-amine ligase